MSLAVVGLMASASCSSGFSGQMDITGYQECGSQSRIAADQCLVLVSTVDSIDVYRLDVKASTNDELRVELVAIDEGGTDDSTRAYVVDLGEPLAGRTLVDNVDGVVVELSTEPT